MSEQQIDPSTGQFIDPLFAIMIAAGVADTIVVWADKKIELPNSFAFWIVFLGYTNLLLSWFGYHKSVLAKPIRGNLRFVVTVVLLPMYLLTIILYDQEFLHIASIYAGIFFLWSFWEYLKFTEHKEPCSFWRLQLQFYNGFAYSAVLVLLGAKFLVPEGQNAFFVNNADIIALVFLYLAVITLRLSKSASEKGSPIARIKSEIRNLLIGKAQT